MSSPACSSFTSSSSRSEMLLRSTLLRDDLAATKISPRRGSISPQRCTRHPVDDEDDDDDEVISPSTLSPVSPGISPSTDVKHSPHSKGSKSPLVRPGRAHVRSPSLPPMPLTPHEQVLRARLEHVLDACREQSEIDARNTHKRVKRASLPASAPANGSGVFGWLWRDNSSEEENDGFPPSVPPVATQSRPQTPRFRSQTTPAPASPSTAHVLPRPQTPVSTNPGPTAPLPFVPPSPTLARHAWSADAVPRSQLVLRLEQDTRLSSPKRLDGRPNFKRRPTELDLPSWRREGESEASASPPSSSSLPHSQSLPPSPTGLVTPHYQPLSAVLETQTPDVASPRPLRNYNISVSSTVPASPSTPFSPSKRFCARSASQTVKNIDGYVSFGAIEGLGMPDMNGDLSPDNEEDTEEAEGANKGWKSKWLTPWKV